MATQKCFTPVRGRRMRATRVDECGKPIYGDCSQVVTDGFVSVAFSAEIDEPDEVEVRNAAGELCVSDKPCSRLKWFNAEIQFCQVDPDLFSMLTGQQSVLDAEGAGVGFRISGDIACAGGVALELWTGVPNVACDPGQTGATYGYLLLPYITQGTFGDFTIENDAVTFSVNARTKVPSGWGVGPYNVIYDEDGNQAPLMTPLGPKDHLHLQMTTLAPPEAVCGCQPLVKKGAQTTARQVYITANTDGNNPDRVCVTTAVAE